MLVFPAAEFFYEGPDVAADIVVENFRPGTLEKMGLGYAALSAENPRLIYCSAKGFLSGPYEERAALDEVAFILGPVLATALCTSPVLPVTSGWICGSGTVWSREYTSACLDPVTATGECAAIVAAVAIAPKWSSSFLPRSSGSSRSVRRYQPIPRGR